ncbi:MAG: hypothetical protein EU536_03650 [Promethearchaeota archaeon]|nr:MAG: hypothetical protein EU536_03650 [Candidatus Lokiarchaeota archaeon]
MGEKDEDLLLGDPTESDNDIPDVQPIKKAKKPTTKTRRTEDLLGIESKPGEGIKICFDTTQNERGKLEDNYTTFKQLVEKKGYLTESNFEFPITFRQLMHYDIVVFACPDRSKIREFEINEIRKYVRCGGGLIIMASSGGDKGRMTNLNELCEKFGIRFNNDQVFDDQHNYGIRNLAISTKFAPHLITDSLELVIIPSSCSLSVSGRASAIVFSDDDAEPANAPVIAVSEYGLGRVVVLGSYDTFRDGVRAGIQVIQHRILLDNMLRWVITDPDLSRILYALSVLKIRKDKKAVKAAVPLYSTSLPDTKGRVSPEALLDQILSNLTQVRSVGEKLEDINQHLVEVAINIKKLNEGFDTAKQLSNDLKKVKDELTVLKLDERLNKLDGKLTESENLLKGLNIKSGEADKRFNKLADTLNKTDEKLAALDHKLGTNDAHIATLDEKVGTIDNKVAQLPPNMTQISEKIVNIETNLVKVIEKLTSFDEKVSANTTNLINIGKLVTLSDEKVGKLEGNLDDSGKKLHQLDEKLTHLSSQFTKFSEKVEKSLSTLSKQLEKEP